MVRLRTFAIEIRCCCCCCCCCCCPPLRFTPKLPPFVRQPSKEEQLALKLTYEERIEHKLWKVRQTAFVELGRLFADESESDNRDNIYANITQR